MNHELRDKAKAAARFLSDHKGENTVLLDVSEVSGWTDYFIITTVRSAGHMKGLMRELSEFFSEQQIPVHRGNKGNTDEGWELIDCGDMVIHLMSDEFRTFYDLEHLWFTGKKVIYSSS